MIANARNLLDYPPMFTPPSPCSGVCRIDQATGWCQGCRRTLTEIADWPMLSAREKREIMQRLDERLGERGNQ